MNGAAAFGLAIGLGACLLFQIQFLLAKLILPWFGGSPSVWSTSLVVFQVLLLAGYAYAHAHRRACHGGRRRCAMARCIAIVLALLAWRAVAWPSPVTPGDGWKPDPDGSPVAQILLLLTGAIGLPFLLLASTSPLLQRWYADRYPGPIALPPVRAVEPRVAGRPGVVSAGWSSRTSTCSSKDAGGPPATSSMRWPRSTCLRAMRGVGDAHGARQDAGVDGPDAGGDAAGAAGAPPTRADQVIWLLLAAVPAALLQATTTKLTQDVAAVPFLWMVPLAIYLLTFIVAFELPRLFKRELLTLAVALGMAAAHPRVEHAASRWPPRSACSRLSAGASMANSPRARRRRRG